MEEVMKGEKYIVIKDYEKEIHILPENKLKQLLEQSKEKERERIDNLLVKEIVIAHKEGTPTSRLTSLAMKIKELVNK